MTHPLAVTNCNIDMESLISDPNRSIATLAITTLLKTGSESSVERLLKQIGSFMSDIADEFKIVVVEAIRALCLKFPQACCLPHTLLKTQMCALQEQCVLKDERIQRSGLEVQHAAWSTSPFNMHV